MFIFASNLLQFLILHLLNSLLGFSDWFFYCLAWSNGLIDWLIDSSMYQWINWLIDWWIDWFINGSVDQLIDWLIDWLVGLALLPWGAPADRSESKYFIYFSFLNTRFLILSILLVLSFSGVNRGKNQGMSPFLPSLSPFLSPPSNPSLSPFALLSGGIRTPWRPMDWRLCLA